MIALLTLAPRATSAQSTRVVRSTEPPAWGATVQLVPELRIGLADGDERYLFGRIRKVAVGKDGAIIVADDKTPVLRMYDVKGKFVRDIGRAGEGPGEYRSMGGLGTFADGRIALWDNRIQRLTYYSADGKVIKSVRVPSGLFSADLFQVGRDGTAYVRTATSVAPTGFSFGWIRVSKDGRVLDTIAVPRDLALPEGFLLFTSAGYDRPFTREWVSTMSTGGLLLIGDNNDYAFEQRGPATPTVRIERPHTPIAITSAERTEWEAWARYFTERARAPLTNNRIVQGPASRVPTYTIPSVKPAFNTLQSDRDGRIWVRKYVAAVSRPGEERAAGDKRPRRVWREPSTFDVFEATGAFLGTIVLPWEAKFEEASGTSVWATVTGELGEETVVRFRMQRQLGTPVTKP